METVAVKGELEAEPKINSTKDLLFDSPYYFYT